MRGIAIRPNFPVFVSPLWHVVPIVLELLGASLRRSAFAKPDGMLKSLFNESVQLPCV